MVRRYEGRGSARAQRPSNVESGGNRVNRSG
jgi:hypothetical protein